MPALPRIAPVAGALLLAISFLNAQPPTVSAAVPKGMYEGVTSDLGRLQIQTDGFSLLSLVTGNPNPAVPNQCVAGASGIGAPVGGGSFTAGGTSVTSTGVLTDVAYTGFFDQNGVVTGTLVAKPGTGNSCVPREATWAAVLRPGTAAPTAGATFAGLTDRGAPVSFATTADGATITRFTIALPQGCAPFAPGGNLTPFTDGVTGFTRAANAFIATITVSGDQAAGAFAVREAAPSTCALNGTFTAKVGGATATPTPPAAGPPPAAAGGVVGTIPAAQTSGLLVSGASATPADLVAQLSARGCNVGTIAVLRSGSWSVYVNGAPAIVNSAFPSPLAASTPFYLRCS